MWDVQHKLKKRRGGGGGGRLSDKGYLFGRVSIRLFTVFPFAQEVCNYDLFAFFSSSSVAARK